MRDADVILGTLERVGEICGDPTDRVYARLFDVRPDFEALFVMDTDGGVRGNMLTTSLNCILSMVEDGAELTALRLEAAHVHHDGFGLDLADLDLMFEVMRDTFRDILGREWTNRHDEAWTDLLSRLAAIRPG